MNIVYLKFYLIPYKRHKHLIMQNNVLSRLKLSDKEHDIEKQISLKKNLRH